MFEAGTDPKPLLQIRNLHIEGFYAERWQPLLHGIDLDLAHGEVLGLIGESGAGKSTLGLAAMGYTRDGCRISKGSIEFDGMDLRRCPPATLRKLRGLRMAYVAQSAAAAFNPAQRLIEQHIECAVQNGGVLREQALTEARELYRVLHLPEPQSIGNRYPHQLSGGQLQRAMTAMAMACHPDLIVFDEPTTALDVTTQVEVLAAIRNAVAHYGTAALYISHDLAVVAQMAMRIMVLKDGRLVEQAETRQMLSAPKEGYTRSLWAVRNFRSLEKPKNPEPPLLALDNISACYGSQPVLKNVSLQLKQGRTLALIGESGSGKSTSARVISGLLLPTQGRLLYQGIPLTADFRLRSREQLRQIQMVYQMPDTALNPKQRISDILGRPAAFYLGLSGKALHERVCELLRMIDLEPARYLQRKPAELSGGQKQRLCIARALAAEPALIICDEVTSALDTVVGAAILDLLVELRRALDVSYLFISHDIATVRAICDDITVLHHGRCVDACRRDELCVQPRAPYTNLLVDSVPQLRPGWLEEACQRIDARNPSRNTTLATR